LTKFPNYTGHGFLLLTCLVSSKIGLSSLNKWSSGESSCSHMILCQKIEVTSSEMLNIVFLMPPQNQAMLIWLYLPGLLPIIAIHKTNVVVGDRTDLLSILLIHQLIPYLTHQFISLIIPQLHKTFVWLRVATISVIILNLGKYASLEPW